MSAKEILENALKAVDNCSTRQPIPDHYEDAIRKALAALDAEAVGPSWVSVEERLPDEDGPDVLVWNTKWVSVLPAIEIGSEDRGWYWLPLSAIPLPSREEGE